MVYAPHCIRGGVCVCFLVFAKYWVPKSAFCQQSEDICFELRMISGPHNFKQLFDRLVMGWRLRFQLRKSRVYVKLVNFTSVFKLSSVSVTSSSIFQFLCHDK